MADILKITAPISINNKVHNQPKQIPTDAIFDLTNPNLVIKNQPKTQGAKEETSKQTLLHNLNKEIFEPLMNSTKAQTDSIRKLVLMARLFETSNGILSESFLDKLFIGSSEILGELLIRDKSETVFKGEFFDSLRVLVKLEGHPKLKEAIISILKYFDCFVNQDNSLKAIIRQSQDLSYKLPKADGQVLEQQIDKLDTLILINEEEQKEIKTYLKNDFIPLLGKILKKHQNSEKLNTNIMSIVHYIVRYDKADPKRLEEAVFQLGDELKALSNLTKEDIFEMRKLLFDHAKQAREIGERSNDDKSSLDNLLSKALDKTVHSKINSVAQNLLLYMVQNESPIFPLMHFIIPFRYLDENTYGEFFIDKDCKERKGEAKEAKNIFFTIQSDKYGNFEVDLLARENKIDLDIKCPDNMVETIKDTKLILRDIIEEKGYRLMNYQVGVYRESQTILQRFPKFVFRKVGMDVKV